MAFVTFIPRRASLPAMLASGLLIACSGGEADSVNSLPQSPANTSDNNTRSRSGVRETAPPSDTREAEPAPPDAPIRTRRVSQPNDDTIGWIAMDWAGIATPKQDWARSIRESRAGGTEFSRAEQTAAIKRELELAAEEGRGVGFLDLTISAQLSEYDSDYQEFYIDTFSPGSQITFRPFRTPYRKPDIFRDGVKIRFSNADAAQILTVPPQEAEEIVSKLQPFRPISIEAKLKIDRVVPAANSAEIWVTVSGYTLFTPQNYSGSRRKLKTVADIGSD